ncbi:tail fiber protein [Pedobacter sp. B4-66]|uniref:tail fiber protein n=1 Tax=Pedobacter sp. B4-66 TaxID=2817280 RepID=UPI001BDAF962|nr:tail fiber protein [Pedobacter sp. B4-66]
MKNLFLVLVLCLIHKLSFAQGNTFPATGNAGVGTTTPRSAFDVAKYIPNGALGAVFGRLAEGDAIGIGTFLGVQGYGTGTVDGKSFSIIHSFHGAINSSIGFLRGGSVEGGSITFSTSSDIERVRINKDGDVGIGTTTPNAKLAVNGKIRAQEIKVETANWPDYVFAKGYQLPSLQETEQYIRDKGHLPGIPSAEEVKANGVDLGEMNAKLLKKIEELTLHLIELEKKNERQEKLNQEYQEDIKNLKFK